MSEIEPVASDQKSEKKQPSALDNVNEGAMNIDGSAVPEAPTWERQTLEKLAFSMLEEQKATRRWRMVWRFIWLISAGLIVWAGFAKAPSTSAPSTPHTAVIDIKGEISADADANAQSIVDSLRSAFEDEGAQAVVILINSPGGSPVQAGMVNDEIHRLKELHKKPVYAVVEDTCASAAYYIAAAADEIYVDKASIVGSIGVLMDGFGFTGLMEKLGVERRLLTAGENKGFLDPFSPQTEAQRGYAKGMLTEIHQQFIAVVRKGRGERLKETPEMFSGLFWSGQQAVAMGLADGLGSLDFVARDVIKAEEIVDYTRRDNVAERLAKRFGAALGEGALRAVMHSNWSMR